MTAQERLERKREKGSAQSAVVQRNDLALVCYTASCVETEKSSRLHHHPDCYAPPDCAVTFQHGRLHALFRCEAHPRSARRSTSRGVARYSRRETRSCLDRLGQVARHPNSREARPGRRRYGGEFLSFWNFFHPPIPLETGATSAPSRYGTRGFVEAN